MGYEGLIKYQFHPSTFLKLEWEKKNCVESTENGKKEDGLKEIVELKENSCLLSRVEPLYHTLTVNTGRKVHPSSTLLLNSKHIFVKLFFLHSSFVLHEKFATPPPLPPPILQYFLYFESIMLAWIQIISK